MLELKLQLLENYYKEHGTINDINQKYTVNYNGEEIKLGSFLNDLRKQHKKYILGEKVSDKTKERFKFLDGLKIEWNPKETDWLNKYHLLKAYKEEYGNIDVPYNYVVNDVPLGVFVANQRAFKRNNKLNKSHTRLLEDLGITWNPQDDDWNNKYNACKKFYNENNHLNIKENYIYNDIDIGTFIHNQRALYQKTKRKRKKEIPNLEEHFKLLEEIGMIWYPNKDKKAGIIEELKKYKKEHGNIDIPVNYYVKINNQDFALGMYVTDTREIYRKNKDNLESLSNETQKRIKTLQDLGISWDPKEDYWQTRYRLLKEYKEENGNIDLDSDYKITLGDKTYNLGRFLNKQRELYRKHLKTKFADCDDKVKEHIRLLNELGIKWNPQKEEWIKQFNYLKSYYDKHKDLNIPIDYIEIINGEEIKLGQIARNQKEALSKKRKEIENGEASVDLMLRYKLLKEIGFTFTEPVNKIVYNNKEYTKKDLCKELNIRVGTFDKYLKAFNNDVDKAIRICLLMKKVREKKRNKKKDEPTLDNMLEAFDIDMDELENYLNKEPIKDASKRSNKILYKGSSSLRRYCIENGYNYGVINYSLKAKRNKFIDEDLDKVIDRVLIDYNRNGQNKAPTWIYSKYGNELLLRHFLISLSLDYDYIIKDMSKNAITLEEAIRNNCFYMTATPKKQEYLEGIFIEIVNRFKLIDKEKIPNETLLETMNQYIKGKKNEYSLEIDEYNTLIEAFIKYKDAIDNYHIYEVGYTKDNTEKVELIRKYNLSDEEIEKSFFVNINYENHSLIGIDSDEYKKRIAIKRLVHIWNELNNEEKMEEINKNKLKYPEDFNTISLIRNQINHLQDISNIKIEHL